MRVLVACEESQAVCIAFREKGHEAYSCDIQECSGGHPEWHIQGDVLNILNPTSRHAKAEGGIIFQTCDGVQHEIIGRWDLIIAHPPCTYLSFAGNGYFNREKYGDMYVYTRLSERFLAAHFFYAIFASGL